MEFEEVLRFWFEEIEPKSRFVKSDEFDQTIKNRFGTTLAECFAGEKYFWRQSPRGRLAEIIVLDQFSRNIYRDDPQSFAADPMALALAQEAVANRVDQSMAPQHKAFLYMPYMHSESPVIHREAEKLFQAEGLEQNHEYEIKHKVIIDRFGRYPHRNAVLGRQSTPEELEFLKQPNSSF